MKKRLQNEKGFTLAELLIVVAIIAVLVAISIPIFTSQLEKARESTDAANIRAAYAEVMVAVVAGETQDVGNIKVTGTGTASDPYVYTFNGGVAARQQEPNWQSSAIDNIGGVQVGNSTGQIAASTDGWNVSYSNGAVSITVR